MAPGKRKHGVPEDNDDDHEGKSTIKRFHLNSKDQDKRLIVILENASAESVKVGKEFELLNSDDHKGQIKKLKRNLADYRPDIAHQCLLMLLDSPLNRASRLQVYIHTQNNVLIEVNPQTRIPRTYKRYAGVMAQLLRKLSLRGEGNSQKLLKIIKNPVSDHLPVGCKKIGTSFNSKKLVNPRELVPENEPIVIVIGAMAHGQVNVDYTEDSISISEYPLSAALTCSKICSAFEEVWGIH